MKLPLDLAYREPGTGSGIVVNDTSRINHQPGTGCAFLNFDLKSNHNPLNSSIFIPLILKPKNMEPGSYTQYYSHLVFSPKLHCPIQSIKIQERLFRYISGIVKKLGHVPLAVNGMYDHVHVFYGMRPTVCPPETVKEIKRVSTMFLNEKGGLYNFKWQEGYGGFSYGKSQIDSVIKYVVNQREHHKSKTFREEYIEFLEKFEIDYDPKYLFAFHE